MMVMDNPTVHALLPNDKQDNIDVSFEIDKLRHDYILRDSWNFFASLYLLLSASKVLVNNKGIILNDEQHRYEFE